MAIGGDWIEVVNQLKLKTRVLRNVNARLKSDSRTRSIEVRWCNWCYRKSSILSRLEIITRRWLEYKESKVKSLVFRNKLWA